MSSGRGISLWQDPFTTADKSLADNLSEHDKTLLSRLHRGERSGLKLERIHGANKHVLVIRTNKKRRLFLWVKDNQIVVIHIMNNHKYDRVPARVMEFIYGPSLVEGEERQITYQQIDHVDGLKPDPSFQLKGIESATCYNQNLIVYDENQRAVLDEKLPVFLHGDFGSGKSAIAQSLLMKHIIQFHETEPTKDFVYYSHLPGLVEHMKEMFFEDNPELSAMVDIERIKFLDTIGLVREYAPQALIEKKVPVGIDEFKYFIDEQHKVEIRKPKPSRGIKAISVNADIEILYDELQLIAAMDNPDQYLKLGSGASNYSQPEVREWVLKVAKGYFEHLTFMKAFDPALLIWNPSVKRIALFVGDEMQGAPRSVVRMIPSLVMHDNVLLCCDSNQSERRLSVIPYIKEAFTRKNMPLTVHMMPGSYRSPAHIMPLINAVIRIKQYINGGLNDNHQSSFVASKSSSTVERGSIQWVDVTALNGLKAKLEENGTVYVVITPEAYVDEAKIKFGGVPVYTPSEARGMEFPVVVQYRIMDKPMPLEKKGAKSQLLSGLIEPLIAEMPTALEPAKHQPRPGKANPIYEAELNAWVIAFSRLVGDAHCFVVESTNRHAKLHKLIKAAVVEGQALMKDCDPSLAAGTREEWEALAAQNLEAGRLEQALVAYRRLGKTKADLDRDIAMLEKMKQDRLDRQMRQAEERKQKLKQEEALKATPALPQSRATAPLGVDMKITQVQMNASIDDLLQKVELSIQSICKAKDIPEALRLLIESGHMDETWYTPIGPEQKIYLLTLLADSAVASAFFELISGKDNLRYQPFVIKVFTKIDWLTSYTQRDKTYTRLHWMMSDSMRAFIFRAAWAITRYVSSDNDKIYESFPLMAQAHFIPEQNTEMTLIALMATQHMEFFRSFIQVMTHQPLLGDDIAKGLLSTFTHDGHETNAIEWISKQSSPALVDGLVEVMMLNLGELAETLASKSTEKNYQLPHQKAALQYCSGLISIHLTKKIIDEENGDLFVVLLRMPKLSSRLMHRFPDGETFITKIMAHEGLRDLFLSRLRVLIENADVDDDPDKLMKNMLDDIKKNVRFDFKAMVKEDGETMTLMSAIDRHRSKSILIPFFKQMQPEAFDHGAEDMELCESNELDELDLEGLKQVAIKIFEDFIVVARKFAESEDLSITWKEHIENLPPDFWTLSTNEDSRPFILRLIVNEKIAHALYSLMLRDQSGDIKAFITSVFGKIDWLVLYDRRVENITRLHWMMDSQIGAGIFKLARTWMGVIPYSSLDDPIHFSSLVVGYHSKKMNTTLPLIAMLFMKHPDVLENLYRSHPFMVNALAQGLLASFELNGERINVIRWLKHSEGVKSFDVLDRLLKFNESALLSQLQAFIEAKSYSNDDDIISLELCLSFERVFQAEKIIRTKNHALMEALFAQPNLTTALSAMVRDNKAFIDCLMEDEALREGFFRCFTSLIKKSENDDTLKEGVDGVLTEVDFQFNALVNYGKGKIPLIMAIYLSPVSKPILTLFEDGDCAAFYEDVMKGATLVDRYDIEPSKEQLSLAHLFVQECTPRFAALLSHSKIKDLLSSYWLRSWKSKTHGSASILMILMNHFTLGTSELDNNNRSVLDAALSRLLQWRDGELLRAYIRAYFLNENVLHAGFPKIADPTRLFHLCFYFASIPGSPMNEVVEAHAECILEALELRHLFRNIFLIDDAPTVLYYLLKNEHWYPSLLTRLSTITEQTDEDGFCLDQCYLALTKELMKKEALDSGEWSALACLSKTAAGVQFLCDLIRAVPRLAEKLLPGDFKHPVAGLPLSDDVMKSILKFGKAEFVDLIKLSGNLDLSIYIMDVEELMSRELLAHVAKQKAEKPSHLQALSVFGSGSAARSSSPSPEDEPDRGCNTGCQI